MAKKIVAPESKFNGISIEDVKIKDQDEMTPEHARALRRAEVRQKFVGVPDQYAETNFFFRNYLYKDAHKLYPDSQNADHRFVDKCYPYAKGGLLLVDEPRSEIALKRAKDKHSHLVRMGIRHVVYEDEMDLFDLAKQEEDDGMVNGNQRPKNPTE